MDTTLPVHIGNSQIASGSGWFPGKLDDIRIYNRSLTALEVTAVYEYGQLGSGGTTIELAYNNTVSDPSGETTWDVTLPQPMPLGTYNGTGTEITQDYLWNCQGNPWAPSNYSFTFHPLICTAGGGGTFIPSGPTDYIAYYPFEYTSIMGKLNGNTIGADGIVVGLDSDTYNYGRNGSVYFDGDNDFIEVNNDFNFSGAYTFGTWAKATSSSDYTYLTGTTDLSVNHVQIECSTSNAVQIRGNSGSNVIVALPSLDNSVTIAI